MGKGKKLIEYILAAPRSLIFCLRVFPVKDAIKLPVIISNRCLVRSVHKGAIRIEKEKLSTGVLRFGFDGTSGIQPMTSKSFLEIKDTGTVYIGGKTVFGRGSTIRVGGELRIGDDCVFNTHAFISCNKKVTIGDDFFGGWNLNIQDSSNHNIFHKGKQLDSMNTIEIGDHVWAAAHVDILKGKIPDGSVIGYGSLVNKLFEGKNVLIAGNPARVIKEGIIWEK